MIAAAAGVAADGMSCWKPVQQQHMNGRDLQRFAEICKVARELWFLSPGAGVDAKQASAM